MIVHTYMKKYPLHIVSGRLTSLKCDANLQGYD